nr:hypothetical protein [Oscillibacter sp.]
MPFLFPDAETAAEVLDSTGGEALNGVLAELGLRGLAYGELGFRYLTADRPVTTRRTWKGCASARRACWSCSNPTSAAGASASIPPVIQM